jgi:anaerobic selenocysteine-containing dehydrogenase
MTIVRAACPYDCPETCGFLATVENSQVTGVTGDPDHPHSRGRLCAKMRHYERTVHSPRRLTTPLERTGPKGSGRFSPISWDGAITRIAQGWQAIIAEYGAEAILPYSYAGTMGLVQRNAGHPFFHRLGASRLERTICTPAKEVGWQAVMGTTPAIHPDEATVSDLIILWGINAVSTSIQFMHRVAEARLRGAKVWGIDVYKTPTLAACDRGILIRPGTDGALALGVMHILVRDGRVDRAFVARQVQGFDELAAQVLPAYPPERVAEITGVAGSDIVALAHALADARIPLIRLGGGLTRSGNGAAAVRAIVALPALVGAYGKVGGGCFCGTATGAAVPLTSLLGEEFQPTPPARLVNMNRLGHALTELAKPPIMSLYVYHANPAAVAPDQNAVLRGLMRDDLFTVVHERFMTDTARHADIILPATSSLEHPDLYRAYGSYTLQRTVAAIPPVGASASNWDVFRWLAAAMGFTEPLFRLTTDALIDQLLAQETPLLAGIDRAALAEGRAVELSFDRTAPRRYRTPSGKIELLNPRLAQPLPVWFPNHSTAEADRYPLQFMTAPSTWSLNASFYEQDELRRAHGDRPELLINPGDAQSRDIATDTLVEVSSPTGTHSCFARLTDRVPQGIVISEGLWWQEFCPGDRGVNALTSQRLTDGGNGSTFADVRVDVRAV